MGVNARSFIEVEVAKCRSKGNMLIRNAILVLLGPTWAPCCTSGMHKLMPKSHVGLLRSTWKPLGRHAALLGASLGLFGAMLDLFGPTWGHVDFLRTDMTPCFASIGQLEGPMAEVPRLPAKREPYG